MNGYTLEPGEVELRGTSLNTALLLSEHGKAFSCVLRYSVRKDEHGDTYPTVVLAVHPGTEKRETEALVRYVSQRMWHNYPEAVLVRVEARMNVDDDTVWAIDLKTVKADLPPLPPYERRSFGPGVV